MAPTGFPVTLQQDLVAGVQEDNVGLDALVLELLQEVRQDIEVALSNGASEPLEDPVSCASVGAERLGADERQGTIAAGEAPGARLDPGCAWRIMTGAPVPSGVWLLATKALSSVLGCANLSIQLRKKPWPMAINSASSSPACK